MVCVCVCVYISFIFLLIVSFVFAFGCLFFSYLEITANIKELIYLVFSSLLGVVWLHLCVGVTVHCVHRHVETEVGMCLPCLLPI